MTVTEREIAALDQVSFAYGAVPAISGLCLSVEKGELFGLLGPNGSGKSTIIRLLSGVLSPHQGRVRFAGRELASYRRQELARRIAVVPQDTHIELPFSVLEVVLMGRSPHHQGFGFENEADLALAYKAMELTEVRELADRAIHELSGGERQRAMVARALAQSPQLLLLDEPTAFLDIKHQVEVYDLVKRLSRQDGLTVVSVLHDLNLAALYCDRLALLKAGRVFCSGTPEETLTYVNIKAVYETEVYIGLNDITGKVHILPLDADTRRRLEEQQKSGIDSVDLRTLWLKEQK
ncbi:MAG TPA: heme ABC transporter ATP-binding protein [Methylomirabilota bacterium]|nr:heme ABC transporter ATP-binding protein [Methylomirabilota bacterium]HZT36154.1 heme ABC transporter ATP-binding protein [Nitrososphaera sp.]